MQKLTYSVPEMAKVLSIGKNTAYELVAQRGFPAIRIGDRRIVVPVDGLKVWLEQQADRGRKHD